MHRGIGSSLYRALPLSHDAVVLVAPYIKSLVAESVISLVSESVSRRVVITRLEVEDLARGSSDVDCYWAFKEHGWDFRICNSLHAKYFRIDSEVMYGSANLTSKGLGLGGFGNLEFVTWRTFDCESASFEYDAINASTVAEDEYVLRVQEASQLLREKIKEAPPVLMPKALEIRNEGQGLIPRTSNPAILYQVYSSSALDNVPDSIAQVARFDLECLVVPPDLNEDRFKAVIGHRLLSSSLVRRIDKMLYRPRRFGEVRSMIGDFMHEVGLVQDAGRTWQVVLRWLLYFLPARYLCWTANYSEMLALREPMNSVDG